MVPVVAFGQTAPQDESPWSFRTRVQLTGTADASESDGYTVYSGIPIEVSLRRDLGRRFGVELSAALESREVEAPLPGSTKGVNLGSLQTLPVNVLFQVRPWGDGRVRPYAGVGANVTVSWEKSGALDSTDLTPGVGLALQLGTDIVVSRRAMLNVDVRWNQLETDLESDGRKTAHLEIHPLSIGIGLGFRF
ncbi:MAG: OmpW family outer membrane protein [Vicinamibacterales bacterium]|nr:OmpW family outer membrane protein [Vicinamibacterales bacterium]